MADKTNHVPDQEGELLLVENAFLLETDYPGPEVESTLLFDYPLSQDEPPAGNAPGSDAPGQQAADAPLEHVACPAMRNSLRNGATALAPPTDDGHVPHGRSGPPTTRLHNYAAGFDRLVAHVKASFSPAGAAAFTESLISFRPALLSTGMTMSEDDLLLVEKSFDRLVGDLGRIITYSGLAIAVWRRTGEIALVNRAFLLLSQRSIKSLVGNAGPCRKLPDVTVVRDGPAATQRLQVEPSSSSDAPSETHSMNVCELFSERTAVEYIAKFAQMALDHTRSTVLIPKATIVVPDGTEMAATLCLTLKRDIFDMPLYVVGSFLVNLDTL